MNGIRYTMNHFMIIGTIPVFMSVYFGVNASYVGNFEKRSFIDLRL